MLIAEITGVTSRKGLKVDKPISKIIVVGEGKALKDLTIEEISVKIDSKTGQNLTIHDRSPLPMAIEMCQQGEGSPIVSEVAGSEAFNAGIDLTAGGSFDLQNDETFTVDIEGLNSAKTYRIYGFELPVLDRQHSIFEKKTIVTGDMTKHLDVSDCGAICIDNFSNVVGVEVTYLNGYTSEMERDELEYLMSQLNDLASVGSDGTIKAVHSGMLTLPLAAASRIKIQVDGTKKHTILLRREATTE